MMTYKEIYEVYEELGLPNYLISSLASSDPMTRLLAMHRIDALNFQNAEDVKLYITMNI